MSAAEWAADVAMRIGARLLKFSRRRTPREERKELLRWDRPHLVLSSGSCAVCGAANASPEDKCPGPPIPGIR